MDDAGYLGPGFVNSAVYDVARTVDAVVQLAEIRRGQNIAFKIDLDEAGSGDFLVQHAVGVDQKRLFLAWHSHRDMIRHHIGHAVKLDKPITGNQVEAKDRKTVVYGKSVVGR